MREFWRRNWFQTFFFAVIIIGMGVGVMLEQAQENQAHQQNAQTKQQLVQAYRAVAQVGSRATPVDLASVVNHSNTGTKALPATVGLNNNFHSNIVYMVSNTPRRMTIVGRSPTGTIFRLVGDHRNQYQVAPSGLVQFK